MRLVCVLAALMAMSGCSFAPTIAGAGGVDAAGSDTGEPTVLCDFDAAVNDLPAPVPLAEINSDASDRDPYLTEDGLTLYFTTDRDPMGPGGVDVWRATRPSRDASFSSPSPVEGTVNSEANDTRLSLTRDGTLAFLASGRDGGTGGDSDIWMASRTRLGEPFGQFDEVTIVNTSAGDYDPHISADGLRLYFSSPAGVGAHDLLMAERASVEDKFGAPAILGLSTAGEDYDPAPRADERLIVFSRNRDVWYATRADISAEFSNPTEVPGVNTGEGDGDPFVTADGCELFFYSDRSGNADIYVVRIGP